MRKNHIDCSKGFLLLLISLTSPLVWNKTFFSLKMLTIYIYISWMIENALKNLINIEFPNRVGVDDRLSG